MASVAVSTSQPSSGTPLQSAKPTSQVKPARPAVQVRVAWGRVGAAIPQPRQWSRDESVSDSQPLVASLSQFAKGAVQVPTAQEPFMHAAMALGTVQRLVHMPQLATFDCVSTQALAQHVWPVGHACVSSQPGTQTLPTQS